ERGDAADPAARVEQLAFAGEGQRDAGRAVAARGVLEPLGEGGRVDHDLAHAVGGGQRGLIGGEGPAARGRGGPWEELGGRAQPGAETRGDDHRAHGDSGSWCSSSARSARRASRALARAAARRRWRTVAGAYAR